MALIDIDQLKQLHDHVVGVHWSMDELVNVIIHLALRIEHIVKVFAILKRAKLHDT